MIVSYNTRDEKGRDICKEVELREYPEVEAGFTCRCCGRACGRGVPVRKIVSANFTDWAYLGEYVCGECARLFSLYFYSYEVSPRGIELFNVREAAARILAEHTPPFRLIVTKSRKKHLFYKSVLNHDTERFSINLEEEPIMTSRSRMRELFDFVECLITIGQSKMQMERGELSMQTITRVGFPALERLRRELDASREIQIPLHCGQKRSITDEEAIQCIMDLTRRT